MVTLFLLGLLVLCGIIFAVTVANNKPLSHDEYMKHIEGASLEPDVQTPPRKMFGTTIYKGTGASSEVAYFIDD